MCQFGLVCGFIFPSIRTAFLSFYFPSSDIVQRLLVMPWKKLLIVRSFLSFIQMFSGPQMETSQLLLWNSLSTSVSGLSEPPAKKPDSRHPLFLCRDWKLLFFQLKGSPRGCIWPESGAVRSYDYFLWAIFLVHLFFLYNISALLWEHQISNNSLISCLPLLLFLCWSFVIYLRARINLTN